MIYFLLIVSVITSLVAFRAFYYRKFETLKQKQPEIIQRLCEKHPFVSESDIAKSYEIMQFIVYIVTTALAALGFYFAYLEYLKF